MVDLQHKGSKEFNVSITYHLARGYIESKVEKSNICDRIHVEFTFRNVLVDLDFSP